MKFIVFFFNCNVLKFSLMQTFIYRINLMNQSWIYSKHLFIYNVFSKNFRYDRENIYLTYIKQSNIKLCESRNSGLYGNISNSRNIKYLLVVLCQLINILRRFQKIMNNNASKSLWVSHIHLIIVKGVFYEFDVDFYLTNIKILFKSNIDLLDIHRKSRKALNFLFMPTILS